MRSLFHMVPWPSGKARVCKTLIRQFKSGRYLQKKKDIRKDVLFLLEAKGGFENSNITVRWTVACRRKRRRQHLKNKKPNPYGFGFLCTLFQDLQIVQNGQDDADEDIQVHQTAQQADNDTDDGQHSQQTNQNACDSTNHQIDDDIDDQSADACLSLERVRKNFLSISMSVRLFN